MEYSHAKDVAARIPGRSVLLVHPERGAVQYRFAHSADRGGPVFDKRTPGRNAFGSRDLSGDPIEPGAKIVPTIRIKRGLSCHLVLSRYLTFITLPSPIIVIPRSMTTFFKLRKDYRTRVIEIYRVDGFRGKERLDKICDPCLRNEV